MEKIGFIGATDKTDLITYIAKTLDIIGKKVIVVDTTILQKSKYIVPTIDPTKSYVTEFDNVDYAVGFENIEEIGRYLGIKDIPKLETWNYDYMLIDIDSEKYIESFNIEEVEKNYFVTRFDIFSLRKGIDILKNLPNSFSISKILLNYEMRKEDEDYLDYLTMDTKVIWNDFTICVPVIDENSKRIEDDQRVFKARIKNLIPEYQESIIYIVQNIIGDISANKIKKIIKE